MSKALRKVIYELKADRRKLSLIIVLCCVLLLLWGRLLVKQVPRDALAVPEAQAATSTLPELPPLDAALLGIPEREHVATRLPGTLARDVFSFQPEHFPRHPQAERKGPAKSVDQPADVTETGVTARQAAQGLKVQSTVMGASPRVIIDGRLYRLGDSVQGLKIVDILPRGVVLEWNGERVRLEM